MGIYTAYDLPGVDVTVKVHMQVLKDLCLSALGSNVDSLILSGSFGRGEGSVILHADGSVEPLRDYDVRLIVRRPVPPHVIEQIRSDFMRVTQLGDAREQFSGQNGFSLTLEPLTAKQLNDFARYRDLAAYDHVHASRLIYGTDHSPALHFPASEIPKVSGLRLLYQKMVGLVGHFAGPEIEGDVRRTLLYECDKTLVEICTALVLLADAYVPSYRARVQLFTERWRAWFPDLADQLPDLADQIKRATQEKLHPGSTPSVHPLDALARARAALLIVHRFYARRLYGIDVTPGPAGCAALRRALRGDYYRAAVTKWLSVRRLDNAPARCALNAAYHRLLRFKFACGAGRSRLQAIRESLRTREGPPLDIFLAAWCMLAAVGDLPDEALLRCGARALDRLPGMSVPADSPSGWERYAVMRERIVSAYQTWEHNR